LVPATADFQAAPKMRLQWDVYPPKGTVKQPKAWSNGTREYSSTDESCLTGPQIGERDLNLEDQHSQKETALQPSHALRVSQQVVSLCRNVEYTAQV
jgi:hypothetical protein